MVCCPGALCRPGCLELTESRLPLLSAGIKGKRHHTHSIHFSNYLLIETLRVQGLKT